MELTLANLKEVLLDTIGQDLIKEGFTFSKSSFGFKKNFGKSKVKVSFFFYDYKPTWLDFNYCFEFNISEVNKETKDFFSYCGQGFVKDTAILFEGDFHPDTANLSVKYRIDYSHRISALKGIVPEIEYSRKLLHKEFLPRIPIYTDLKMFQEYIMKHPEFINKEIGISTALVAIKLKGMAELENLVAYLLANPEIASLADSDFNKQMVNKIIPYAKLHP